ncbi:RNA polymerase sigma-70 factor (ECF subfamily) [Sunxiuqinia elliptica]|uniref:RNA polymerase sigma-70 factor (ECF subfamily) n=1 Tax=Sunxiuqinia elliptica TaxID=655355 RepID=A0A4R6H5J6_9BACT|nr:RNA polymerase sigma-70 factor (ECF subfamily) [Sunxiuqinia elliptica]TDO58577.1 RNA polymerase sigma-70 factor (ECF subfamily) [Sunxiuqinia elliptica]
MYFWQLRKMICLVLSALKDNITQELLLDLKAGNMLAFDKIYELYSHKLYSFIRKILKNEQEAEDVMQEVFVKLWEHRERLENYQSLNAYIFTMAYNHSIDLIRKRMNNAKYLDYLKNISVVLGAPSSTNELEFNELNKQVENLISRLPERQRQVYLLHREEGLSYPEIANQLGISKNTVENHMVRALRFLREHIDHSTLTSLLFICLFS